jgi:hypothetical protein
LVFSQRADAAELLILSGSEGEFVRECGHKDVVISGSRSKFVLTGGCQSVSIPGDGNQILAELAGSAEIYVRGSNNDIAWTKSRGEADPAIVTDGQFNNIVELGGEAAKTAVVANSSSNAVTSASAATGANNAAAAITAVAAPPGETKPAPANTSASVSMPSAKERDRPGKQSVPASNEKMAQAETDSASKDAAQTEAILDLHSAVALTIRHCHHHRHNNRPLCRYLE